MPVQGHMVAGSAASARGCYGRAMDTPAHKQGRASGAAFAPCVIAAAGAGHHPFWCAMRKQKGAIQALQAAWALI